MTSATATSPRIYVACIGCYNAGHLVGAWIDAAQDASEIHEEIGAMLRGEHPAMFCGSEHRPDYPGAVCEEWRIDDTDELPSGAYRESIESVSALACGIEEHGEAFGAWWDLRWADGLDPAEWDESFSDAYCGEWRTAGDYAEETCEGCGPIPEWVASYVDWDAMARDWEMGGDYHFESGGLGVLVFRAC